MKQCFDAGVTHGRSTAAPEPTESGASELRRRSSLAEKQRILSEPHCPECGHPDCNGQCYGDDMMGASE